MKILNPDLKNANEIYGLESLIFFDKKIYQTSAQVLLSERPKTSFLGFLKIQRNDPKA